MSRISNKDMLIKIFNDYINIVYKNPSDQKQKEYRKRIGLTTISLLHNDVISDLLKMHKKCNGNLFEVKGLKSYMHIGPFINTLYTMATYCYSFFAKETEKKELNNKTNFDADIFRKAIYHVLSEILNKKIFKNIKTFRNSRRLITK